MSDRIRTGFASDESQNQALAGPGHLAGKRLLFLGSSVTFGCEPEGISFVEYLADHAGCLCVKAAVSGTTLADVNGESYVSRLKRLDPSSRWDALVVQLSTNDAGLNHRLGVVVGKRDLADYDVTSVAGAIEYIIAYAKMHFDCPVLFFTGTRFDSPAYGEMVALLLDIQRIWPIGVLDLWHDPVMNRVTGEEYRRYMADGVHPTRAGYFEWWGPRMETMLGDYFRTASASQAD